MLPLEVETVVLCDDIRQEANGKYLLIGVYGSNIVVRRFPVNFRLAVWLLVHPKVLGTFDGRIRVVGPQDAVLADGHLAFEIKAMNGTIMAIPGLPLQLQREGQIRIELSSSNEDDWTTVKSVQLTLDAKKAPQP